MSFCVGFGTPHGFFEDFYPEEPVPYYPENYSLDIAVRYAVSGKDCEVFRNLAEAFLVTGKADISHIMYMAMILYKKHKFEELEALIDVIAETDSELLRTAQDNDRSYRGLAVSELNRYADIVDNYILGTDGIADIYEGRDFMDDPLYFAMITENVPEFIKHSAGRIGENNTQIYLCSAIAFRNISILQIMFSKGAELTLDTEQLAFFCMDDSTINYLCKNFPEHIFKHVKYVPDTEITASELIMKLVSESDLPQFAKIFFYTAGAERFKEVFDKIPLYFLIKENLTDPVKMLLDEDSEELTSLITSLRLVNTLNISEVIEYLTQNKLLHSLNALHKMVIPHMEICFDPPES